MIGTTASTLCALRRLTADWFKPSSLNRLQSRLDELSVEVVARMEAKGGRCDFSRDVAVWYPLQVILAILGLPEGDYPRMLKLTQELFGGVEIAKGDWLYLSYLAANRDPKMFPNPHAFDIDRPNADNTSRSVSGRTFVWVRNSPVWRCEACFASSSPASNT